MCDDEANKSARKSETNADHTGQLSEVTEYKIKYQTDDEANAIGEGSESGGMVCKRVTT